LAVGDIINFNANAASTFTPAAGVQIMILFVGTNNGAFYFGCGDPGGSGNFTQNYSSIAQFGPGEKFGITNTSIFTCTATNNGVGFSGIQIK
jgi:hypothetical protein